MLRLIVMLAAMFIAAQSVNAGETAEALIRHINVAQPDRVIIRERDQCKIIIPYHGMGAATWKESSRSKPVACVGGLATSDESYQIDVFSDDGNRAGTLSGRLIVAGLRLEQSIDFKPFARATVAHRETLLFKIGADKAIQADYYLAATSGFHGWRQCNDNVTVLIESANEAAFIEQKEIDSFVNGALETAGFVCPDMRELSLIVLPDLNELKNGEKSLLFSGAYYKAPKGWFSHQWRKPRNYAFERVERVRLEAERQARYEAERAEREARIKEEREARERERRLRSAYLAYDEAVKATSGLDRLASVMMRAARQNASFAITPSKYRFSDPVVLVGQSRRSGEKIRFSFPAEISSVGGGELELKWPVPSFKGIAVGDAAVASPGWYLLSGTLMAEGKSGMVARLEVDWAYRCRQSKCNDDLVDMVADIHDLPDFRDRLAARKDN